MNKVIINLVFLSSLFQVISHKMMKNDRCINHIYSWVPYDDTNDIYGLCARPLEPGKKQKWARCLHPSLAITSINA